MMKKQLPLVWEPTLGYAERYGRVGKGYLEPDSIWVSGAVSKLENLNAWIIDYQIKLDNIRENVTLQLPIISSDPALSFDQNLVSYHEIVTEYTEGELTLMLNLENAPRNQRFNFSPSTVTVQYRVPIEQYSEAERARPFEAYVDYGLVGDKRSTSLQSTKSARKPPSGSIAYFEDSRKAKVYMPFDYGPSDSERLRAGKEYTTPEQFINNKQAIKEGKRLYGIFCSHCHGDDGKGNGPVYKVSKEISSSINKLRFSKWSKEFEIE